MVKDLVIIGGGPAGNSAALSAVASRAGSVVVIERGAMGGTCTNRGCVPTKFLLSRGAEISLGGASDSVSASWKRLLAHKTALVNGLARSIESRCIARGVEVLRGEASFVGPNTVRVVTAQGDALQVDGEKFIIATGSEPAQLGATPYDGRRIMTSTDALDLDAIPRSMAIIGSGAVGSEFCLIFTRLGVKVTLIEAADRLFPQEDPDVDAIFRRVYERLGVGIRVGSPVQSIKKRDDRAVVHFGDGEVVEAEVALVGVGRALGSRGLGCSFAGIETGPRGEIIVDERLATSQPHIFAAGDVTGRMMLAHAASFMGEQAARAACDLEPRTVPYRSIPWATFTAPEVAAVGMTVAAAAAEGVQATSASVPLMDSVKARIDRETEGFMKVVVERGSGRILGGTIVGQHASDLIHIIALAVHEQMNVDDVRGFSFLHPSVSELIGDLFACLKYS